MVPTKAPRTLPLEQSSAKLATRYAQINKFKLKYVIYSN